ncbi:MAG: hypothetical protein ACRDZO_12140 [Egibacteraceae bacterium]
MATVFFDSGMSDDDRRPALYEGALFVFSPRPSTIALCDHMRVLVEEAFAPRDPRLAHHDLPVGACVEILASLKPAFIHHPRTRLLARDVIDDLGCDLDQTFFDLPRMRSAYPADYLTAGIAYAFHPHRDTWYSAPYCQLNWWLPVYGILPSNCLAFHPRYFSVPVPNDSEIYNYYRWNAESRATAANHVKTDTRKQPKPLEPIDREPQTRLVCPPGGLILFSGAQLHETVPNTSGLARYSMDFRTAHLADLRARRGAPNVDSRCTGTTLRDYLRAADLTSRLPPDVVAMYDDDTANDGVLIYTPRGE